MDCQSLNNKDHKHTRKNFPHSCSIFLHGIHPQIDASQLTHTYIIHTHLQAAVFAASSIIMQCIIKVQTAAVAIIIIGYKPVSDLNFARFSG